MERASGHAELSTGGGAVRVNDSNLSGMVSTGGGSVLIRASSFARVRQLGAGPVVC